MALQLSSVFNPSIRVFDLVINSEDRFNYNSTSSTEFRVQLQNPINHRIVGYGLKSAVIPKTNYNIPVIRNTFQVIDSTLTVKTITIPAGNYTMTDLLAEIVVQLNASGPDTYTATYDPITGKVTITSTFATFELQPSTQQGSILYKLGFNPSTTYTAVAGTITAPNVADISGIKTVFIKIKQLTQYIRNTTNSMLNFKLDLGCQFGSIVYFADENKYHQYYNIAEDHLTNQGFFDVSLVDEYGIPVNLNGRDWSFVLQFITTN